MFQIRQWIAEVREVADEVEDVVEIFISKVSSSWSSCCHARKLKKKNSSIQAKIHGICKSIQMHNIRFASEGSSGTSEAAIQRRLRRLYPGREDEDVLGLEDSVAASKGELTKVEDQFCVVTGMGGLGKTTIAKKV